MRQKFDFLQIHSPKFTYICVLCKYDSENIVNVHETAVLIVQITLFIITDFFKKTHLKIINPHILTSWYRYNWNTYYQYSEDSFCQKSEFYKIYHTKVAYLCVIGRYIIEEIVNVHAHAVHIVQIILFIITDHFKKTHLEIINPHIL